ASCSAAMAPWQGRHASIPAYWPRSDTHSLPSSFTACAGSSARQRRKAATQARSARALTPSAIVQGGRRLSPGVDTRVPGADAAMAGPIFRKGTENPSGEGSGMGRVFAALSLICLAAAPPARAETVLTVYAQQYTPETTTGDNPHRLHEFT